MANTSTARVDNSRAPSRSAPPAPQDTGDFEVMVGSITDSVKDYGTKHPIVVASTIFLAGFYLGWKVKPW